MSDNWITLIPEDPMFVPDARKQSDAGDRFAEIAPDADDFEIKVCNRVEFFNCGSNFGRILCPSCHSEIPVSWWKDRMNEDYRHGFILAKYASPCCCTSFTLHELVYEWQQGFGRFALSARNPHIGKLDDIYKKEFEEILGTKLRVIYLHI
ncbi:MAG TPA: hypothetical protein VK395_33420 [Gemmataceae bacterium]|nr:hypothetical protein [Gemmataceae bacterium]